jgi:hypothetical protein
MVDVAQQTKLLVWLLRVLHRVRNGGAERVEQELVLLRVGFGDRGLLQGQHPGRPAPSSGPPPRETLGRGRSGAGSAELGYVSKLLSLLDRRAAVERTASGQVARVDLRRLLVRHAEDAPLDRRATRTSFIDPRGLTALMEKLRKAELRYAVTGIFAAARRAPVTAPRVVSVYLDDPEAFATAVGLRPPDSGANVLVLVPDDDLVFEGVWEEEGIRYAASPRSPPTSSRGRGGPAEADALLEWMTKQREVWRG